MTMATPRCVVASTRYGATHWGSTCTAITRSAEAPLARPASTNGISRTVSATERMTRPPKGMRVMAMATMTAGSPVPMAMEMAMARMRSGKDWRISMMRWLTRSKRPPEVAAGHAPQRADRRPEQHRGEGDEQRGAGAVDHAAQGVAPDLVGAEEGLRVGRLVHAPEIRLERIARRQQRRGQRHEDDRGAPTTPPMADSVFRRAEAAELAQDGAHQPYRMRGSSHA